MREFCPFHTDEDIAGHRFGEDAYAFECTSDQGHPAEGPYRWLTTIEAPAAPGISGLADELGLSVELPSALETYRGRWVEYGVVEAAYAAANPNDFARLVATYSHTAIAATKYSASTYLATTLGHLSRTGSVLFHPGKGTGRWSYNSNISWWALPPAPDWAKRSSWADLKLDVDYVPGSTE